MLKNYFRFISIIYLGFYYIMLNKFETNKNSAKWSAEFIIFYLQIVFLLPFVVLSYEFYKEENFLYFFIFIAFSIILILFFFSKKKLFSTLRETLQKRKNIIKFYSIIILIAIMILFPLLTYFLFYLFL